jgi:hypothetical protein
VSNAKARWRHRFYGNPSRSLTRHRYRTIRFWWVVWAAASGVCEYVCVRVNNNPAAHLRCCRPWISVAARRAAGISCLVRGPLGAQTTLISSISRSLCSPLASLPASPCGRHTRAPGAEVAGDAEGGITFVDREFNCSRFQAFKQRVTHSTQSCTDYCGAQCV